jgi:hypothetical protein
MKEDGCSRRRLNNSAWLWRSSGLRAADCARSSWQGRFVGYKRKPTRPAWVGWLLPSKPLPEVLLSGRERQRSCLANARSRAATEQTTGATGGLGAELHDCCDLKHNAARCQASVPPNIGRIDKPAALVHARGMSLRRTHSCPMACNDCCCAVCCRGCCGCRAVL